MALAGAVLGGHYVLDQQIGAGGYSEAWQATHTVLRRPVAIKLLHPRHVDRSEALARFQAEARHAGASTHQNIARVYDYGEPDEAERHGTTTHLTSGVGPRSASRSACTRSALAGSVRRPGG